MKLTKLLKIIVLTFFLSLVTAHASLLVYEPFDTGIGGNISNGIYTQGEAAPFPQFNLSSPENATTSGGNIVGFTSSSAWSINTGTLFRPRVDGLSTSSVNGSGGSAFFIRGSSAAERIASRAFAPNVSVENKLYGSALIQMDLVTPNASARAFVGFSGSNLSNPVMVGYLWNGSNWDLSIEYLTSDGIATRTILEDIDNGQVNHVVWSMEPLSNTVSVWVNPEVGGLEPLPNVTFTDFDGDFLNLDRVSASATRVEGASGLGFAFDEIRLGTTWDSVAIPEPRHYALVGGSCIALILLFRRRFSGL